MPNNDKRTAAVVKYFRSRIGDGIDKRFFDMAFSEKNAVSVYFLEEALVTGYQFKTNPGEAADVCRHLYSQHVETLKRMIAEGGNDPQLLSRVMPWAAFYTVVAERSGMTGAEKDQMSALIRTNFPQFLSAYEKLTTAYRLAFTTLEGDHEFLEIIKK